MKISELKKRLENVLETQGDTNVMYINLSNSSLSEINNLIVTMLPDGKFSVILSEQKI